MDTVAEALGRLVKIANGDTGQSKKVADFLLAWWNAESLGGFDLTDLFAVDQAIADDMTVIFAYLSKSPAIYPNAFGYEEQFKELVRDWRPQVYFQSLEDDYQRSATFTYDGFTCRAFIVSSYMAKDALLWIDYLKRCEDKRSFEPAEVYVDEEKGKIVTWQESLRYMPASAVPLELNRGDILLLSFEKKVAA